MDQYTIRKPANSSTPCTAKITIRNGSYSPDWQNHLTWYVVPKPTATPTVRPTPTPTIRPTATPTVRPTPTPTIRPTATPTVRPTPTPTIRPTATPQTCLVGGDQCDTNAQCCSGVCDFVGWTYECTP
jgi:hypothetical protein